MGSVVIRRNGTDGPKVAMHNSPCATLGPVVLDATMPRKRSYQRFIAWLAVVAMGMVVVLPTVSRALASPATLSAVATGEGCAAHQREAAPRRDPLPSHGTDACGYCTLASHSPVVMGHAIAPLRSLPATPFAAQYGDLQIPSPISPEAHSRGPPLA